MSTDFDYDYRDIVDSYLARGPAGFVFARLRATPGPNKVRFVDYGDDGHIYYQCLRCGLKLEGPIGAFCTFCGTEWALGHVTNRRRRDERHSEAAWREYREAQARLAPWVMESRWVDQRGLSHDWENYRALDGSALDAWRALKEARNREMSAFEYRVRRSTAAGGPDVAR